MNIRRIRLSGDKAASPATASAADTNTTATGAGQPGDAVPSTSIFALMSEAEHLLRRRTYSSASYEAMRYDLYQDERAWLAQAFDAEGDDPHGWIARHPTLIVPLLEAYPLVRAAYPTERLLLARVRYDTRGVEGDDDVQEHHILDEEWEEHPPEIVVDREWFGDYIALAPDEHAEGNEHAEGEETPALAGETLRRGNPAMEAEDDRLAAVLGDDQFGRAENWWGHTGAHGGWRVSFTPYCADDFLDTDLTTNEELAREAEHERALLAEPAEVFPPDEDNPDGWTYHPGNAAYLAAVEREILRRDTQGIVVQGDRGLPLSEAEEAHNDRWIEHLPIVGEEDSLSPTERAALDAEGERLRSVRIARLYAERDRRRALAAARAAAESTGDTGNTGDTGDTGDTGE